MAKEYGSDEDPLDNDGLETASTSSSLSSSSAPDLITSREDYDGMVDEFIERYELVGRKLKPVLPGESGADKLETLRRALRQDERVRVIAVGVGDEKELDDEEFLQHNHQITFQAGVWFHQTGLDGRYIEERRDRG